jgi:hypothetical protein
VASARDDQTSLLALVLCAGRTDVVSLDRAMHTQAQRDLRRHFSRSESVIRIVVLCWKVVACGCSAAELFDFFQ